MNRLIRTSAPAIEIEDWLKKHDIKYQGWSSVSFSKWLIEDEQERVLFKLRWGT